MKNNKIGKTLTSFVLTSVLGVGLIPGMTVFADSSVEISEMNFPDENFRKYVSEELDKNEDGKLSSAEIKDVSAIECPEKKIKSMKGIEFFTDVDLIDCNQNEISELDTSKNTKLTKLSCSENMIKELDLSENPDLKNLDCSANKLTQLNLEKNTKLDDLSCSVNEIDKLDLTNNTKIRLFDAYDNKLTSVDLSGLTKLKLVWLQDNQLQTFDVGEWEKIESLRLENNNIEYLDISKCKRLVTSVAQSDEKVNNGSSSYKMICNGGDEFVIDHKTKVITDTVELTADETASLNLPISAAVKVNLIGVEETGDISWKSSDPSLVTVDKDGVVKAVKGGYATLTASVESKEFKLSVRSLYKDVQDGAEFWYEPTYALTDTGVVKGYSNQTKFKPANICTRAQMVTFIWRLAGSPEPETKECKFSDVKKSDYFYKACLWGNENHIVEGYKDGTFGPQIVCARRHAVTFLWRLAGKPEPSENISKSKAVFKDISTNDYFYKACLWASEKKIVAGYDDGTFRPEGDCLRRQMVTFLYKYDKFINTAK